MRWIKRKFPTEGSERIVEKFLILPVTISGETRWLEKAKMIEVCVHYTWANGRSRGNDFYMWEAKKFLTD